LFEGGRRCLDTGGVRDVALQDQRPSPCSRDIAGGGFQTRAAAREEADRGATTSKYGSDSSSNARRGTRNHHDLPRMSV
jgi:hypothetical protein